MIFNLLKCRGTHWSVKCDFVTKFVSDFHFLAILVCWDERSNFSKAVFSSSCFL
uniref:Uncharacterized protein n=1 Tax=Helianthus annuus TaxID=4232 RepID=A0A251VE26_HELAN